ncbi:MULTISPECIES: Flp pilus assembly protein CpaB [unclassified Pseudomonas]|uniref:Flp pilus assembly protein CpaB n=1 Tax=unclassified Pseudomonas TaxID=196821 RepID=UPI002AC9737E|nr:MULTISPECIES: Flp pilus assembly protein CpaB [unclassified Pseudomonas]MEB0041636.1 Flp pilus assembly protein CpaB [Pseudomonas sp. MH10]MEB0121988.1 Flp pilus assembly protein CpaB [Pseudomonas sp. CCI1.2]WPX61949.1 Flp pilus assembly protein CpaB [Pseudomonas sp. MH10]
MNSRVTLGFAVFLLLGALFAGYWGLVLSRPTSAPIAVPVIQTPVPVAVTPAVQSVEDSLRQPVLVLTRDLPPGTPITAADVLIERVIVAPVGIFNKVEDAVGRSALRVLSAGTWLSDSSFDAGGALARMIRPSERALAVAIDEVIGAGGQLNPGDYVDVMLFLPQDGLNVDRSAQLVIPALRVLSVGELLGPTLDGQAAGRALSDDDKLKLEQRRSSARNVVLAVPEQLLSRLMLATQSGTLRLAVRSAEEKNLQRYWAGENDLAARLDSTNRNLMHFEQLSLGGPGKTNPVTSAPRGMRQVEIIRGNQITQQTP